MNIDRGGKRSHRVMRRHPNEEGFGERGDAAHFADAADNADIRLDEVGALDLQQAQELVSVIERLAGCEHAIEPLFQVAPGLDIFRTQRLLVKQRVVGGQGIAELPCGDRLEDLGVGVEGDLVFVIDRFGAASGNNQPRP